MTGEEALRELLGETLAFLKDQIAMGELVLGSGVHELVAKIEAAGIEPREFHS